MISSSYPRVNKEDKPSTIGQGRLGTAYSTPSDKQHAPQADQAAISFGVKVATVYVFLVMSRMLDVSRFWVLHIPLLLLIALVFWTITQGDIRATFSYTLTRRFAGFTGWVFICFPLSYWRGGSVDSVISSVESFGIFVIIVTLVKTERDWRRIVGALAYAVLVASLLGFKSGQSVQGRLALSNGTLADPNEYALALAVGLPFWWLKASNASAFKKVFYFVCTVPVLICFAKTGSRAGLVILAGVFLILVCFASMSQRFMIATVGLIAVLMALTFLPGYLTARFTSIFSDNANQGLDKESQERLEASRDSAEERQALLRQSIRITFEHPIFGIGPGVFPDFAWDQRKKETGVGGIMFVTHNTYTQISSETGFPGFFLFASVLFLCVKYMYRGYKSRRETNRALGKCYLYMLASLVGLSVGIFFLSEGYTNTLAIMFALAASLHNVVPEEELSEESNPSQLVQPSPAWQTSMPALHPRSRRFARLARTGVSRSPLRSGTRTPISQNPPPTPRSD